MNCDRCGSILPDCTGATCPACDGMIIKVNDIVLGRVTRFEPCVFPSGYFDGAVEVEMPEALYAPGNFRIEIREGESTFTALGPVDRFIEEVRWSRADTAETSLWIQMMQELDEAQLRIALTRLAVDVRTLTRTIEFLFTRKGQETVDEVREFVGTVRMYGLELWPEVTTDEETSGAGEPAGTDGSDIDDGPPEASG